MALSSPMIAAAFRVSGMLAVAAIGILSLVPGHARPHVLWPGGLEHVLAYFVAASLLCLGFLHSRPTTHSDPAPGPALRIACLLTGYGGILEALQLFVPGREPAMLDWGADALGAWLGAGLVWLLRRPVLAALH
jgi:VanZ family protein